MENRSPAPIFALLVACGASLALAFGNGFFLSFKSYDIHIKNAQREKIRSQRSLGKARELMSEKEPPKMDTENWKIYKNDRYKFQIKYPADWPLPQEKASTVTPNYGYEAQISFRSDVTNPTLDYKGFDVLIYSTEITAQQTASESLSKDNTEAPALNNPFSQNNESHCSYKEVSLTKNDLFYTKDYYYHIQGDLFTYDIFPIQQNQDDSQYSKRLSIKNAMPEFYTSVDTFLITEEPPIKKAPPSGARRPVSITRVSCREKNDGDPSYSKTKGKHMDEDCCPDPDEWAKPGCIYSPRGYGILISGSKKKK
jgi:hypothetical protein